MESIHELLDAFMEQRVVRDVVLPVFELGFVRQFAVDEQVRDFEERAFFRELLNGITPVAQDTFIAIDECDFADAGCAGSYVIIPKSSALTFICRRSIALIESLVMGMLYSFPVRLSVIFN
jgi:hypothetical protein